MPPQSWRNARASGDFTNRSESTGQLPLVSKPLAASSSSSSLTSAPSGGPRSTSLSSTSSENRVRSTTFNVIVLILVTILVSCINFLYAAGKFGNVSKLQAHTTHVLTTLYTAMRTALESYQDLVDESPFITMCMTFGTIFGVADIIAQRFIGRSTYSNDVQSNDIEGETTKHSSRKLSINRTIRFSCYGLFIVGPIRFFWNEFFNFDPNNEILKGVIMETVLESFSLYPLFIFLFVVLDSLACRRPAGDVKQVLRTSFVSLWVASVMFWTLANIAIYLFEHQDIHPILTNVCLLLWNTYFSRKVHNV